MSSDAAATAARSSAPAASRTRRRWLTGLTVLVVVLGVAWGAWWLLALRYQQTTEDAYVSGNVVQLTPQVFGTVIAIHADDTDLVKAGAVVVDLDPADAQVALDAAKADLAKTVRDVRALYSSTAQLKATVAVRESDLERARDDLHRREGLAASGAVSGEELEHARTTVTAATSALAAARQQYEGNRAQTSGTTVADHPLVQQAAARLREAFLALRRTRLLAPVTGYVAKRSVQVGERVQPGTPLLAIVPLDEIWVDANFKEDQIRDLRLGQEVTLRADLYGRAVTYHGRIVGLGAGTGSAFAALPAQNATGNWIKVVQRLPVRIGLEPKALAAHPLPIGMSMRVTVATRDRGGAMLAGSAPAQPRYQTAPIDPALTEANALVDSVIRANAEDGTAAGPAPDGRAAR